MNGFPELTASQADWLRRVVYDRLKPTDLPGVVLRELRELELIRYSRDGRLEGTDAGRGWVFSDGGRITVGVRRPGRGLPGVPGQRGTCAPDTHR